MNEISVLVRTLRGEMYQLRQEMGLQEILRHDAEAVEALRSAEKENARLRSRVKLLEKIIEAEGKSANPLRMERGERACRV